MPVYNHYYVDEEGKINTPGSVWRLVMEGPTIPVVVSVTAEHQRVLEEMGREVPLPVSGVALIDTGATFCAVDERIIRSLGIPPYDYQEIAGVHGTEVRLSYPASLSFPGTPLPNITFWDFVGAELSRLGIVALLGRNILSGYLFVYNGSAGHISLAF